MLAAVTASSELQLGSFSDARGTSLVRAEDGTWRGVVLCPARTPVEIQTTEEGLLLRQRRYPVAISPEETTVQDVSADFVFRRSDGKPVPAELVLPLMIRLDPGVFCLGRDPDPPRSTWGIWLEVQGIGRVEAFRTPPGQARPRSGHQRPPT